MVSQSDNGLTKGKTIVHSFIHVSFIYLFCKIKPKPKNTCFYNICFQKKKKKKKIKVFWFCVQLENGQNKQLAGI